MVNIKFTGTIMVRLTIRLSVRERVWYRISFNFREKLSIAFWLC